MLDNRPNILFITTDQQRGDCLGVMGRKVHTPHMDLLASEGVLFRSCITPNLVCQPSRSSILTGLLPLTHGVSDNGICGVTPAGGATAPASLDLSAGGASVDNTTYENWAIANGFDLANNTLLLLPGNPGFSYVALGAPQNCATTNSYGTGCDGLSLDAAGLPSIGNGSFTLRANAVPAVSPVAFFGFGTVVQNPGLPLGPILGMNGCEGYTNLDIGLFGGGLVAGGTSTFSFPVPSATSLVGSVLSTQALALSLSNPCGLASSNGVSLQVGQGY